MAEQDPYIRLFKPSFGEEELANVKGAFDRSWVGGGGKVIEFEQAWTAHMGSGTSLAVNSATAALDLSIQAFGFERGKKVLVPSITFAATAFAPVYNGLEPVFVDVDEETCSMSMEDMERKYTKDVVAIMPVHYSGHPARMKEIMEFAKAKGLKVVEDCAHTTGPDYQGRKLGLWGDIGCFSFEEKKCLTTGDGGMMCSSDAELMERIRPSRWLGINRDAWSRYKNDLAPETKDAYHWYYEISVLGHKFNMNDLAASIGLAQLQRLQAMNARRSAIIRAYLDGMAGLESVKPLLPFQPEKYVYQMFGIRTTDRDNAILFLRSKGIATAVHYMPLGKHPFFAKWNSPCPVAERIWETFITLPLHADMTDGEVTRVIEAVRELDKKG